MCVLLCIGDSLISEE